MDLQEIANQLMTWLDGLGLKEVITKNEFFSGGFLLMVLGTLGLWARDIPRRFFNFLRNRIFVDFTLGNDETAFEWVDRWFAEQTYTKNWSRRLTIRSIRTREHPRPQALMSPAPGTHWMIWNWTLVRVVRQRDDQPTGGGGGAITLRPREKFFISILTIWRDMSYIERILKEAAEVYYPPEVKTVDVMMGRYDDWRRFNQLKPRPLSTVVLPEDNKVENLVKHIRWFLDNASWFEDRGIPHRFGCLFHGPPGNGKTSTCIAIASELGMNICVTNIGSSKMGDEDFQSLLMDLPSNAILVLEDVDCVFDQREQSDESDSHLTFSGLLNALDGVVAAEGRVLLMTTNHIEKLDPALIREGRCDEKILIGNATASQGRRLFLRFFPEEVDLAETFGSLVGKVDYCMAKLQGHLLKYAHDPEAAVDNFMELNKVEPKTSSPPAVEESTPAGEEVHA